MSVSCECSVLAGRRFCLGPIPRPEDSYRLWCVIVCDLEISRMRQLWPSLVCCAIKKQKINHEYVLKFVLNDKGN